MHTLVPWFRLLKDNDTYQRKYKELKKQFEQVSAAVKRTFVAIGCAELADDRPASTRSSRSSRPPHNFRRPPPSPIQRPGTVPARLSERPDSAGSVVRLRLKAGVWRREWWVTHGCVPVAAAFVGS